MNRVRPLLSLLVPTRQRTERLRRLLDSLVATTVHPEQLEVVLVVDADDQPSIDFVYDGLSLQHVVVPPGQPMGSLNRAAAAAAHGEYFMLLNDDVVVRTDGWDQMVLRQCRRFPDGVVLIHVNDTLLQQNLCTFPLVTRAFCDLCAGICPAEYERYRIDDHIEDLFNLLNVLGHRRTVYLPEVIFQHLNAVVMPEGHLEYHAEPATLARDAHRFETLFSARKQLAVRLLEAIEGVPSATLQAERAQKLDRLTDPMALRTPGRQLVHWERPLRAHWRRWEEQVRRARRCWHERGVYGLAVALGRRLRRVVTPQ